MSDVCLGEQTTRLRTEHVANLLFSSQLNIYLLTLSDEKMSDSDLLTAISETPPNCLILIEGESAFVRFSMEHV